MLWRTEEAESVGDLLVAAASGVQLVARSRRSARPVAFHEKCDVFGFRIVENSGSDLARWADFFQRLNDCRKLFGGKHSGMLQGLVGAADGEFEGQQPLS